MKTPEEILNQLNQGIGFKNQDIFAQKALAKAAGMSIEDINKQLTMKEKLYHLSGEDKKNAEAAVAAGLDLTNVNDEQLKQKTDEFIEGQKINGQITDMGNVFKGIVATVGGALVPLFSTLATILSVVMKPISFIAELINAVVSNMWILIPLVTMFAYQMAASAISANAVAIANAGGLAPMIGKAIAGIYSSFMSIPFGMGIPLAIAATAGFISMMTKAKNVGDLKMPAGQGPTVTTAEGGIYKGTKNDDVAMAPGITSKLDDAIYQQILSRLALKGFDLTILQKTVQL